MVIISDPLLVNPYMMLSSLTLFKITVNIKMGCRHFLLKNMRPCIQINFVFIQCVCNGLILMILFRLAECNLTDQLCEIMASALQSSNSSLRELDLSNNNLQDSGVKQLCAGLKSPNCQLNILRFDFHIDSFTVAAHGF